MIGVVTPAVEASTAAPAVDDDLPGWVEEAMEAGPDDIEATPWEEAPEAPLTQPEIEPEGPATPSPGDFPEAVTWEATVGTADPTAGQPVAVRRTEGATARRGTSPRVEVEVLDHAAAERAGVSGFVFEIEGAGDRTLDDVASSLGNGAELPVELAVDYAGVADLYGPDYASRLQVVALPRCALAEPRPEGCRSSGIVLDSTRDPASQHLVVDIDDLTGLAGDELVATAGDEPAPDLPFDPADLDAAVDAEAVADGAYGPADVEREQEQGDTGPELEQFEELEPFASVDAEAEGGDPDEDEAAPSARVAGPGSGAVVLAVTADVWGDVGTWAATPLSPTGSWSVGQGTGEFSYTHEIEVPAPAAGTAPSVSLSYSSGSVDGLTHATNTQGSPTGVGWSDFANAFIERSYEPCFMPGKMPSFWTKVPDLCWDGQNATISLGPVSGALIPLDGEYRAWRLENDPNWLIERIGDPDQPGERWKVTAADGTQYFFGLHVDPDVGEQTNGVWWVPVYAFNAGDPCYGNLDPTFGRCNMPWRWQLDRVVDPDGNLTTYWYSREANHYDGMHGLYPRQQYISGGYLDRIEYGGRAGTTLEPAGVVTFAKQPRTDVPTDLVCGPTTDCTATSPAFFTRARYSSIRTDVLVGTGYRPVAIDNLIQTYAPQSANKLYLNQIQHVALYQAMTPLPNTIFSYTNGPVDNRLDCPAGNTECRMRHYRMVAFSNPTGATTTVTYGRPRPCAANHASTLVENGQVRWDKNGSDCFPQATVDNGNSTTGIFHKYLVTQVVEDPGYGSAPITTVYGYEDPAAWAYDYGAFARQDLFYAWSQWRGYGTAVVTQGASKTRTRLFRGLDGDLALANVGGNWCPCGEREATVDHLDGAGDIPDDEVLVGRTLETEDRGSLNGSAETVLRSTRYQYEQRDTEPPLSPDYETPRWAAESASTERVYSAVGVFQERGSRTTYNANYQPATTAELGWLHVADDDRCSVTAYADNPAKWMFQFPKTNRLLAGACPVDNPATTTVDESQDFTGMAELSASETYYDETPTTPTPLGTAPTRGNPTRQRSRIDAATWAETRTTFDGLGRPTSATDATGATTTTAYTASPSHAIVTGTLVTNPLGHETSTTYLPEYGVALSEVDTNGRLTTYGYDPFGRLTVVRLPTEQGLSGDATRSWQFAYHIDLEKDAPPMVHNRQYTSVATSGTGMRHEDTWVVYDGLMREMQAQTPSPAAGKVVVKATTYDNRGNVYDDIEPQAVTGTIGTGLLTPPPPWANRTRHSYDALNRPLTSQPIRGNTQLPATTTGYGVDTVTVTGPDGQVSAEKLDGLGRTVEASEKDGAIWATSEYSYDLADNLRSVTDAAGNETTYGVNMAGWRTTQDDPDRGTAQFFYDDAGRPTRVVDGNDTQVHTTYDDLGRPMERRSGSATGPLLASWAYDATGEEGLLNSSTRHVGGVAWTTDVTGYDTRNRSLGTKLTVPAGVPVVGGQQFTTTTAYDRADRVISTTYPAVGGLAAETVTTTYNSLGLPSELRSPSTAYVSATQYDDRGRIAVTGHGPAVSFGWMLRYRTYDADQRLVGAETATWNATAAVYETVAERGITYTNDGRVTEQTVALDGDEWRECFGYDDRARLDAAYTTTTATTCSSGTNKGTGPQPYDHSYTYSVDGNLEQRSEGGTPTVYDYPAPGSERPHAPETVGTAAYEWDGNGNLDERTVGGTVEDFTWDAEQRLASVVATPGGTTDFTYDVDGQRLLRRSPAGTTLYLPGQEVTVPAGGSAATAVRSYSYDGELVATRTSAGVDFLVTDGAGSVELSVPSSGTPNATRTYEPYGEVRSEVGSGFDTDRGFLGQVEDTTTSLSYLNARYYDSTIGLFISTDPVYDTGRPKTLNPYAYSVGSPVTFSDPSGLTSSYTYGLEETNKALMRENKALVARIGEMGAFITQLQGIIKQQQKWITDLLTRVDALEARVRAQAQYIRHLEGRVAALTAEVNRQRAVISRLKAKVREQAGIIRGLRSRVEYLNGVVRDYTWHVFSSKLASQRYLEIQRGQGLNLEGSQLSGTWAYMTFQGQRIEDLGMDIGRQTQENWTLRGDNAGLTDELGKWRQAHIDLWHLANAALDDIYGTGSVWDGLPDALGELCEVSCIGSGGVITDPRELCDLGKESPICGGPGALP